VKIRWLKAFCEGIAAQNPVRKTAEIHFRIALMNHFSARNCRNHQLRLTALAKGASGDDVENPANLRMINLRKDCRTPHWSSARQISLPEITTDFNNLSVV
jgi:hypothetical protein